MRACEVKDVEVRAFKARVEGVITVNGDLDSCASRLRPKNIMKMFPATMGAMDMYPQFSEKWAMGISSENKLN